MFSYACLIKKLSNLRVEKGEEGRELMRMSNNIDNGNQGAATIAVGVDEAAASQNALRWAIDYLVSRFTHHASIKLVHVINPGNANNTLHAKLAAGNNTLNEGQAHGAPNMDFLLPFRCYCTRKGVQCETVILEDQDVAEALIGYIRHHGIEHFVLGAISRTGFSRRIFKASESIPGRVQKWAPQFCCVYTIKQGKVSELREATRSVPNILAVNERAAESEQGRAPSNRPYDEISLSENDISFVSSGRPSTDSMIQSFYQNVGPASESNYLESIAKLESDYDSFDFNTLHEPSSTFQHNGGTPFVSRKVLEGMEDEIKRLRVELKQTMDMYHAACKEAVATKQKAIELEQWKLKEGQRLEEARLALEATRAAVEKENVKSKPTILAADDAAQRFSEKDVQTTISADQIFKALREADDEQKIRVLDALGGVVGSEFP